MSGGALDYAYMRVQDVIQQIPSDTLERRTFKAHLMNVAAALKAIEWNMSGDGDDDENKLILNCVSRRLVFDTQIEEGKRVLLDLHQLLLAAQTERDGSPPPLPESLKPPSSA